MRSESEYQHWRRVAAAAVALVLLGAPLAALADRESEVAALEARCEKEREARIKPLREAEVAKCKAEGRNDPGYCERFWKDYGNAVRRPNGTMIPRLFDDLPVCAEAFKARRDFNRDGN